MNKLVFADNYSARTSAGTQGIQRTNSHTVILGQEGDDSNFIGATDLDWNNDMAKKGGGGGRPPGANFPPKGGNAGDDRRRGPNNEGTKQGGNPGTKAGNGPWKTVGYKIPKVQGGSKGEGTGTSSENLAGKASADPPSKTLRGLWIREKRCLTCGSETHFRAEGCGPIHHDIYKAAKGCSKVIGEIFGEAIDLKLWTQSTVNFGGTCSVKQGDTFGEPKLEQRSQAPARLGTFGSHAACQEED